MTPRSGSGRWLAWTAAVAGFWASAGATGAAAQTVRVLVAEGRTAVTVASRGGLIVTDATGRRTLARQGDGSPLRLLMRGRGVLVQGAGTSASAVIVWPSRVPMVEMEGQVFRGYLAVQRLNGALAVVNAVEMEDYLQGVLKDEIPPGWPAEAAKAMAVTARTYAAYQMRKNPAGLFHLRATTASQVYGGAAGEDARTSWAVQATRGKVLTIGGQPIPAFYHSCSGGATEDAPSVFGGNLDFIVGVKDDFSLGCPYALWVERLSSQQVQRALLRAGYSLGRPTRIEDLSRSRSGRILQLAIRHTQGTLTVEGKRFREALGTEVIRSTDFEVRTDPAGFTFVGRGWGHGVGLSQWGAKEMADLAYQHQDILKFYYPLADLQSLPSR
jgi:stage II sporulation protein D